MNDEYRYQLQEPQQNVGKADLSCAVANGMQHGRTAAALMFFFTFYFCIENGLNNRFSPLGAFSALAALFISAVVLYGNGARFRFRQIPLFLGTAVCAVSIGLMASPLVRIVAAVTYSILLLSWIYSVCRPAQRGETNAHTFMDCIFAWFVTPFAGIGGLVEALFCKERKAKKQGFGLTLLWIILGLLITLPVTFFVAYLLLRGDALFEKVMSVILDNIGTVIINFLTSCLLAIPFASILFSALDTGLSPYFERERIGKSADEGIACLRILPNAAALSATIPLIALYLLFFGVPAGYFLSAFQNYLPDGFTFAEYARRGFFELCIVAVINLCVILIVLFFCKRSEKGKGASLRFIIASLSFLTAAMMVIAIAKMVMYISSYGLTHARVIAVMFMLFLGITFLLLFIYAIGRRFRVLRWILAAVIVLAVCFSAVDLDRAVTAFNVQRYLNGSVKEIDLSYVDELTPAASAELAPIVLKGKDPAVKSRAEYLISDFMRRYENADPLSLCVSDHHAYRKLAKLGFTVKESKTHLTLTVRLNDYYLPVRQIEIIGEDFNLTITRDELEKGREESGVYKISCDPYVAADQSVFFAVTDNFGDEFYSNTVSLLQNEGDVWIELYENDFSDEENWSDLIAEKWSVTQS